MPKSLRYLSRRPFPVFVAQDKLGALRRHESQQQEERRALRHSLEQQESRGAQLEATRRGLQGDLQRFQQLVRERDAQIEVRMDERQTWALQSR